jgi:hypothetical protein
MATLTFSPPNMVKKYLVAFSDLFNKIELPTADGSTMVVPIRMGTTEALFAMAQVLDEDRNRVRYSLPLLGFSLSSMEFDTNRPQSMMHTLASADKTSQIRQPVPYNFNVDLFLLCARASELFQILEIILPQYQSSRSYPLIEYKFKDGSTVCRDVPIELVSPSFDIVGDLSGGDQKVFSSTLGFKMQGWLHQSYLQDSVPYIKTIDLTYEDRITVAYEDLTNKPIEKPAAPETPYIDKPVAITHIDEETGGVISNVTTELY